MNPFPKTQRDVITLTIDEDGDLLFLQTDSADIFMELGKTVTKRASHVEPAAFWARVAFHILRTLVRDDSSVAAWTRTWDCAWRINTKPVGGPILTWKDVAPSACAAWMDDQIFTTHYRQEAIDAEIIFLNKFFAERTI
jgi:hypothetical protein